LLGALDQIFQFTHNRCPVVAGQIVAILKQADAGTAAPALCRENGISSATFYKWRSKFGGMDASLMTRMRELEDETRRLKKLYAEALLTADIVKEAMTKKW
jgi:putative transposase